MPTLTPLVRPVPPAPGRRPPLRTARPLPPGRLGPARRKSPFGWRDDGRPRTDAEQLARVMLYGSVAVATSAASTAFVILATRAGVTGLGVVAVAAPTPAAGLTWAYGMARFRPVRPPAGLLPRPEPGPLADPNPSPVTPWWWISSNPGAHQRNQRVTQSSTWWPLTVRSGASAASRRDT